jgi:vacuolar-type H+-ATPase subunit E/Vma4
MKKVTLEIENSFERKTVSLDEELSVGRTSAAHLVISDAGLSRVNSTFFSRRRRRFNRR